MHFAIPYHTINTGNIKPLVSFIIKDYAIFLTNTLVIIFTNLITQDIIFLNVSLNMLVDKVE